MIGKPVKDEPLSYAQELANTFATIYPKIHTLLMVADYYTRLGQRVKSSEVLSGCYRLVKEIKVAQKFGILIDIVDVYIKNKDEQRAYQILSRTLNFVKTLRDRFEKDWLLGAIAIGYAKLREYDKSLRAIKSISDRHKDFALQSIVDPIMRNYDYKQAFKIVKLAEKYTSESEKLFVRIFGFDFEREKMLKEIAQGFIRNGQYSRALKLIDTLKDAFCKTEVLTFLAGEYIKSKNKEKALGVLSSAFRIMEVEEFSEYKIERLVEIAERYAEARMRRRALKILSMVSKKIRKIKFRPEYGYGRKYWLSTLAWGYANCGSYNNALRIIKNNKFVGWRKMGILDLISLHLAKSGQLEKALKIIINTLKIIRRDKNKNEWNTWILIKLLCRYSLREKKLSNKSIEMLSKIIKRKSKFKFPSCMVSKRKR